MFQFIRVLRVLRVIRLQRLIAYLETDISKHLARMVLSLMVGLMMCTAIFQLVENDDPGARMERYMSGYDCIL